MEQKNQNNQKTNGIPCPQDILKLAADRVAVDRSQLGINTPRTSDGLQPFNEGFDFLQHGDGSTTSLHE